MYYVTGGMPEPVLMWTEARDVSAMQEALSDIIGAYERDFAKHPNVSEFPKISMIWKSIPSSWQGRIRSFSTGWSKRAQEPVNTRTPCSGWWMPGWCIRSTAAPLPGCPCLPMMICPHLRFIWWMWVCSAVCPAGPPTAFGEGSRLFTEFKAH